MTTETTPKTAEEILSAHFNKDRSNQDNSAMSQATWITDAMKEYALQVAQQVRQQCAESAQVIQVDTEYNSRTGDRDPVMGVDKESILSVNIDQFIK